MKFIMKYAATTVGLIFLIAFCLALIFWVLQKPLSDQDPLLLMFGPIAGLWLYSRRRDPKNLGTKSMKWVIATGSIVPLVALGTIAFFEKVVTAYMKIGLVAAFVMAAIAAVDVYILLTGGGSLAYFLNLRDHPSRSGS